MKKPTNIIWADKPDKQDYPAAENYLSLLYKKNDAAVLIKKLKGAAISEFAAKDILRAAALALDDRSDHVKREKKKIRARQKLSPILLVRDGTNGKVIVADGFHRLCAAYLFNEDAMVPSKII
jgi:hypothetical protein